MADISRVSGILGGSNGLPPWHWYPALDGDRLRLAMTRAINCTARAALRAGAREIMVHEACPLDLFSLDKEIKLIRGGSTLYLDKTFAGIAFVGQGIARRVKSPLGIDKNIRRVKLNGQEADEASVFALYAGALGVPVLFASGAAGSLKLIRRFIPGLITDRDPGRAAERGLAAMDRAMPVTLRGAITVEFTFGSETLANMHARLPNARRTGTLTTAVRAKDMRAAFEAYRALGLVAAVDWLANKHIHKSCVK